MDARPQQFSFPYATPSVSPYLPDATLSTPLSTANRAIQDVAGQLTPRVDFQRAKELLDAFLNSTQGVLSQQRTSSMDLAKDLVSRPPGKYGSLDPGSLYGNIQQTGPEQTMMSMGPSMGMMGAVLPVGGQNVLTQLIHGKGPSSANTSRWFELRDLQQQYTNQGQTAPEWIKEEMNKLIGTSSDPYSSQRGFIQTGTQKPEVVYRAVDSHTGESVLGKGTYFDTTKDAVKRYGSEIKKFELSPKANMLDLQDPKELSDFSNQAILKFPKDFMKTNQTQAEKLGTVITKYAKSLGFDGIRSVPGALGSVVFNSKFLKPIK